MSRSSLVLLCFLPFAAACETKAPPSAETAPTPAASPTPAAKPAASVAQPAPVPTSSVPVPDATPPKEATRSKSGIASLTLTPGTGKTRAKKTDSVRVKFTGWSQNRQAFASKEPTVMAVEKMPPGWQEALLTMVEGQKSRFWIPGAFAFGNIPGGHPPPDDLILEMEFLGIVEPPAAPADLKQPPKDAKKTASGLVYRSLSKGTGTTHPTPTSRVTVHYSGWTKQDGKLFDSSVMRGSPATFGLNGVVPGWTEGVQLMVVGEKMRFWIPAKLGYGEKPSRPGTPSGDLVFDIELISIK
jgi:FKBP-type peptidyl-prolyl cis-trans isomerase